MPSVGDAASHVIEIASDHTDRAIEAASGGFMKAYNYFAGEGTEKVVWRWMPDRKEGRRDSVALIPSPVLEVLDDGEVWKTGDLESTTWSGCDSQMKNGRRR